MVLFTAQWCNTVCFMSLVEELKPENIKIIENPKQIQISNS